MSTFKVTAEELTVHPHPNADRLELAQVGLYKAVVPKGVYKTGDYALYIPEQAVLPDTLIEELGLTGKLAGKQKNRVKAVRLRGELSQGIVCMPKAMTDWETEGSASPEDIYAVRRMLLNKAHQEGHDFSELLGITKYVPEIPVHMSGEVEDGSELLSWVDIENVKRYPGVFEDGEEVVATEKIHGTCCILTYIRNSVPAPNQILVSSKGLADKHLALVHDEHNLYWRTTMGHSVHMFAREIAQTLDVEKVAVYGEIYGAGVQDLTYSANAKGELPGYAVFDVRIAKADGTTQWLDTHEVEELIRLWNDTNTLNSPPLEHAPVLYRGPYDSDTLWKLASGSETVSGTEAHIREGLVVRPAQERYSGFLGGRAIVKFVSDDYLLRDGGTEYE